MKKLIIFLILGVMIFSGCTEKTGTEIQTKDGKLTVSEGTGAGTDAGTGAGADWCKAGTSSTFTSNSDDGQGSSTFIIKGITTYKGRQVCEAETKVSGTGSDSFTTTYFYSEDEKYTAWIMKDATGKIISENEVNNP